MGPTGGVPAGTPGGRKPFVARVPPGVAQAGFSGSVWGTEGPEFKSRQPDKQCAGQVVFLESTVWPVVALGA